MLALVVPEMVCAAVLVMKSVPELPVSAENAMVDMVVVGAVVSTRRPGSRGAPLLPAVS
ncbi:MAG: hypothetical protein KF740_00615 [Ramlibacter sp.]|nr:hypothetical protein [Ramlibacter sp.]